MNVFHVAYIFLYSNSNLVEYRQDKETERPNSKSYSHFRNSGGIFCNCLQGRRNVPCDDQSNALFNPQSEKHAQASDSEGSRIVSGLWINQQCDSYCRQDYARPHPRH